MCILLLLLLILFVINFINHFIFNYKCPLIIRDLEVAGIYPTLILIYITITSIISCIVIISKPTSFTPYSSCYTIFTLYTTSLFDFTFMANDFIQILITFCLTTIYILETYFAFSRYYNVCDINHKSHHNLPFTIYCIIWLLLSWLSITILPILTLFLSIFHILNIAYFSYYFHHAIRESYAHIFHDTSLQQFGRSDTYSALEQQIKQVQTMSILSTTSSIITAYCYSSNVLCGYCSIIPLLLSINCLLFFAQFTKNRISVKYIFSCKGQNISHNCVMPCSMIIERRNKRKWIRDRQKSIFDRLQQTVLNSKQSWLPNRWSKKAVVDGEVGMSENVPVGNPIHAHSLNNSVDRSTLGLACNDMSIEILDMDIDPDNEILNIEMLHTMDLNNPFDKQHSLSENSINSLSLPRKNSEFKPVVSASTTKIHTAQTSLSLNPVDSVRSDISDVLTKMRSIGQTLRGRTKPCNLDLVKELASQIKHDENMNYREEFKKKEKQKEIKDLKKEATILKMKEKTNKQISFGADIALEIIKNSIISKQENETKNENHVLPLFSVKSEPPLMSSYIYEEDTSSIHEINNKTQFKMIDMKSNDHAYDDAPSANLIQKQRSHTAPNSPDNKKVRIKISKKSSTPNLLETRSDPVSVLHNMAIKLDDHDETTDKLKQRKTVFLYDMSTAMHSKETNMSSFEDLTHTQSLIEITKEKKDKNNNKKTLTISPINTDMDVDIDGSYIVYEDYFYNRDNNNNDMKDDIHTPLTPTTPNENFENINLTPFDEKNMTVIITSSNLKSQNSEQSKTKSIMGTIRGMFTANVEDEEEDNNNISMHSNTKSITNTSKLAKINAFLKQNGMTQHHQNVNEIFRNMRFTKHNELQSQNLDVENNENTHKKTNTLVMETIAEH